jgi:hypothetical protein
LFPPPHVCYVDAVASVPRVESVNTT